MTWLNSLYACTGIHNSILAEQLSLGYGELPRSHVSVHYRFAHFQRPIASSRRELPRHICCHFGTCMGSVCCMCFSQLSERVSESETERSCNVG